MQEDLGEVIREFARIKAEDIADAYIDGMRAVMKMLHKLEMDIDGYEKVAKPLGMPRDQYIESLLYATMKELEERL